MSKKEYIEKEAAIGVVDDYWNDSSFPFEDAGGWILKDLKRLEPANVKPVVRSKWVHLSYDEALCVHCGYVRGTPFESTKEAKARWAELPPYCEMCGADMREEDEDE